jgi:tetratricopeptide (TPR) repeat protein
MELRFEFDDGSVFEVADREAFRAVIAPMDLGPEVVRTILRAAVAYYWENRRQPNKWGEEPWAEPFATKAILARRVLQLILAGGELAVCRDRFGRIADRALTWRGQEKIERRAYADAEPDLSLAARLNPEGFLGWKLLGWAEARQGKHEEARRAHDRAVALNAGPYAGKIRCPTCAWAPYGEEGWECEGCSAVFDTFKTRARCPRCSKTWEKTMCLGCSRMVAHLEFYRS